MQQEVPVGQGRYYGFGCYGFCWGLALLGVGVMGWGFSEASVRIWA